jgi:hypothetical protein
VIGLAGLAAFVYRHDSARVESYQPATAVAIETDGDSAHSSYSYRVGDRLCTGSMPGAVDPGTTLTVYYDKRDVCTSVTIDPAETRFGDQAMLLFVTAYLGSLIWVGRLGIRLPKELAWQAS